MLVGIWSFAALALLVVIWTIVATWREEPTSGNIYVDFGVAREPTTTTVVLNLCGDDSSQPECGTASPATRPEIAAAFIDGDLRAIDGGGKPFPVDQVTINAVNMGIDGLQIKVAADALQPREVQDGRYQGVVVIERGAVDPESGAISPRTDYRVTRNIVINLTDRTPARALLAFLVLSVGAFLGAGTKWVNETLAPLAVFRRRWKRVHRRLERWWKDLPEDAQEALRESRVNIRQDDSTELGVTLDALVQQQSHLIAFARAMRDIKSEVEKQERALGRLARDPLAYQESAMEAQATLIGDLHETTWPWSNASTMESQWEAAKRNARLVTREVREYVNMPSVSRRKGLEARFAQVAQAGREGLTTDLPKETTPSEEMEDIETELRDAPAPAEPQPRLQAKGEAPRNPKETFLDGLPLATTAITGAGVVAVGMMSQFFRNTGFDGSLIDYLTLGGWAFAIEVAGITVLELGGQLSGGAATGTRP